MMLAAATALDAQDAPARPWRQYASPAGAGFSAAALEDARRYADSVRSGAVMAIYRGNVLVAWGDVTRRLELHSVRKSVVSALYGDAVARGQIDPALTLAQVDIDDRQALTPGERAARLSDLLAARSGVYLPAAYAAEDQDRERPERGSHAPGTHFFYNNWDFNVLGVIYERLTSNGLFDAFTRRIAQPLGMEDWRPDDGFLVYEPSRSQHPAHTFRLSARDLARFGQLYLQRGSWNGREVIPGDWVARSTRPVSDFGGGRGYGLLWWTYAPGSPGARYPSLSRYTMYAGSGTGGQLVLVIPEAELVIVHRGDTDNGREVSGRDAWTIAERILAARQGEPASTPTLATLRPVPFASQAPEVPRTRYVTLDTALLSAYAGEYELSPDLAIRVFVHAGRLFATFPGRGEAELLATGTAEFTIMPVAGVRVIFQRDAAGRVSHLDATIGREALRARRR